MSRRMLAIASAISIACGACGLVLGIDGDVVDRDPTFNGEEAGTIPPVGRPELTVTPTLITIPQGGTATFKVTRKERPEGGTEARLAKLTLVGLPRGVVATGEPSIREGETITITLTATPNAAFGTKAFTLKADDVGNTEVPMTVDVSGNIDTAFGDGGIVTFPFEGDVNTLDFGIDVEPGTNAIYVAYHRSLANTDSFAAIARCDVNGVIDTKYGGSGFLDIGAAPNGESFGRAVFALGDGGVRVLGDEIADLEGPTESVPFSFGSPSTVKVFVRTGAEQDVTVSRGLREPNGTFLGLGTNFFDGQTVLFRADPTGAQANAFGAAKYRVLPDFQGADIAPVDGGALVVAGETVDVSDPVPHDTVAMRLIDGGLDPSFGDGGIARPFDTRDNRANAAVVDGAGRTLLAGEIANGNARNTSMRLARLTSQGQPDPSFGDAGATVLGPPPAAGLPGSKARAVLLVGNKFVIAGAVESVNAEESPAPIEQRIAVARFLENGAVDPTFGIDGFSMVPLNGGDGLIGVAEARRIAPHGNGIIVAGTVTTRNGATSVVVIRYKL